MPTLVRRPNVSIQTGTWSIVGGGGVLHTALSDNLDSSYIQNVNKCRLPTQVAKVGIEDVALPVGSKIFSVRVRIRVEQVSGSIFNPQPLCIILLVQRIIVAALTVNISKLFQIIFGFSCPRPAPTVTWVTQDLAYYTEQPAGGEWTQASFNDFEVHLGRDNTGANLKISEVYVDIDYNERPVGTATGPTGTITDTTRPLVQWTYSDPESDRQQAFSVRIFSEAQYTAVGFDPLTSTPFTESTWLFGEDLSWTIDRDLVNGNWRAYVQVEQIWNGIGKHRSVQTSVSWTQNVPGPPAPTMTASVEDDLNRVRLNVTKGGETPATETYNIEFSDNLGVTWDLVRDSVQIPVDAAGAAQVYDNEAPLNVVRQYRAQAFRTLGAIKIASGFSNVTSATPSSVLFWLKDPLNPTLNSTLPIAADGDSPNRPRSQGVFSPIVANGTQARKIVVTGPQYGIEGTLELIFTELDDQDYWAKFNALYDSGRTLLLQYPTGEQHYIALGPDLAWEWQLFGTRVRYRRATVSYTEVLKP